MKRMAVLLLAVALATGIVAALVSTSTRTNADPAPQSAREVRGATPNAEIENEAAPKLIVDPPLPDMLAHKPSIVWIQWRVENVHIAPVFGKGALNVSPRVGHLHIQVDDVPWLWADASNINTIDVAGLPPGRGGFAANPERPKPGEGEHRSLVGEDPRENRGRDLISAAAQKTDEISVPGSKLQAGRTAAGHP